MDIRYLLLLQEFRNGPGAILAAFFAKMTFLGELTTALFIMAAIYWCIDKELGTYLLMGFSGNRLVNGVLKVTVCAYRPWIRDPAIVPHGDAITTATGYSFPSGHTMNAATVFGGGAVRKDFPARLRIMLGLMVVLVAFSRNFLGVHTPQDVLVGMIAGTLVMYLTYRLMTWLGDHPEKSTLVCVIGLVLAAAVALYAGLKSYPQDYDSAGKLIVDGAKMANDTFKGVGWCSAFLVGWILERRAKAPARAGRRSYLGVQFRLPILFSGSPRRPYGARSAGRTHGKAPRPARPTWGPCRLTVGSAAAPCRA